MKLEVSTVLTKEEVAAVVLEMAEGRISKGACIRALFAGGLSVKEIAQVTEIRYNHVYNVIKNEVVVNGLEVVKTGRGGANSKKAQIVRLLQEGKSITEIANELQCLYNYVWQVAKKEGFTKNKATVEEGVVEVTPIKPEESDSVAPEEVREEVVVEEMVEAVVEEAVATPEKPKKQTRGNKR